jgi:SAM-dependent methyltransferase
MARTHDHIYLQENRYETPKESFKFCLALARDYGFSQGRVYDFGCAAGEQAYFLRAQLRDSDIYGVDVLPELIAKAKQYVPGVSFAQGSVLDRKIVAENSADLALLSGVHSIFDDPLEVFDNLMYWTRPQGLVIVFGLFNRYPIDTFVRLRRFQDDVDHREEGWNMISQATVGRFLDRHAKVKQYQFHEFTISVDLLPYPDDVLRSWTFKNAAGERLIMSGTGLIHDFSALVIAVK